MSSISGLFDSTPPDDTKCEPKSACDQIVNHIFSYESTYLLPRVFECGPGTSLTAMLKKINGQVANNATAVAV